MSLLCTSCRPQSLVKSLRYAQWTKVLQHCDTSLSSGPYLYYSIATLSCPLTLASVAVAWCLIYRFRATPHHVTRCETFDSDLTTLTRHFLKNTMTADEIISIADYDSPG